MVASELDLCARLLRALAHRVRGDLSVITNDLAYIATLIDPAELERPRSRCAKIAQTLGALSALAGTERVESIDLATFAQRVGLKRAEGVSDRQAKFEVDTEAFSRSLTLLRELCGELSGEVILSEQESGGINCAISFNQPRAIKGTYQAMSDFAAAELGERFVVEGCLIDLIACDNRWSYEIKQDGAQVVALVKIPASWQSENTERHSG
jgi:two-component sensor histidine kinase